MESVAIQSVNSSATLSFSERQGDYFVVSYVSSEVSFKKKVWGYTDCELLVDLFEYIAKEWKGWSGSKEWSSLESDLGVSATCDNLGHVTLSITIREHSEPEPWDACVNLIVEPGQTERISKHVNQFFA